MRNSAGFALALTFLLAAPGVLRGQTQREEVIGVLRVTADEASIGILDGQVRLIQVPPQTAVAVEPLFARTAATLLDLDGKKVRATGLRDGGILWSALVEEIEEEEEEAGPQVIDIEEGPSEEPAPQEPPEPEEEAEPAEPEDPGDDQEPYN